MIHINIVPNNFFFIPFSCMLLQPNPAHTNLGNDTEYYGIVSEELQKRHSCSRLLAATYVTNILRE